MGPSVLPPVGCFPGSVSSLHHCSGPAGAPGADPGPDSQTDFLAWPGTCPITVVFPHYLCSWLDLAATSVSVLLPFLAQHYT